MYNVINRRLLWNLRTYVAKIFEKVFKYKLVWWLERNKLIRPEQFGFRQGIRSLDDLALLTSRIHSALRSRRVFAAMFLDLVSDFDHVHLELLFRKLFFLGNPTLVITCLYGLCAVCSYVPRVPTGHSYALSVYSGLVQGSMLSPILFLLYVQDLVFHLGQLFRPSVYADDIVLWLDCANFMPWVAIFHMPLLGWGHG
ncbi:hypothetical protein PR048_016226 [Dryococelus australis]|uniref:Reverse transcriptase domain-containing protein n=1 Tax=Dryococelus australis TaxID=614101 RepID=A0ABQ9HJ63_9NEOP|nr:hypothetical protein PR048_016226 [Dryococelus australis]